MGLCLQPSQPTHIVKLRSRLDFAICIPGRIYFKLNYHIERERAKIDKKKCKNFVKKYFCQLRLLCVAHLQHLLFSTKHLDCLFTDAKLFVRFNSEFASFQSFLSFFLIRRKNLDPILQRHFSVNLRINEK